MRLTSIKLYFLTISTAILATACENGTGSFDAKLPTQGGDAEAAAGKQGLGVKNYEQMYQSMLAATGVNPNINGNTGIRDYFTNNKTNLPNSFTITEFAPTHVNAVIGLTGLICDRLIKDGTAKAAFYPAPLNTLNTGTGTIANLFANQTQKQALIDLYFDKFWGVELEPTAARIQAKDEAMTLMNDLISNYATNNSGQAVAVAEGMCVAVLSSNIFF